MPDVFTKAKRSEVMARIRGRGNKETEMALAKLLRRNGITGWRRHAVIKLGSRNVERGISGGNRRAATVKPDFVFSKQQVAVFVDGCFWHGCPRHATKPRGNAAFWRRKLTANQSRDRRVNRALHRQGWTVLRIWEHELTNNRSVASGTSRSCSQHDPTASLCRC